MASGANVRIWDADPAQVSAATSDIVGITDQSAIEAALARMPRADQPDILINDAGCLGQTRDFLAQSCEHWQKIIAVDLVGTMQVTQALLPRMLLA
jgi:3-oxoacyl-[acyl-carrier protein] reductase